MSLWRNGDFLRLWSAQTISQFGTQVTILALPLAAILVLDASAFEVAVLTALEWLPWLLFGLPAGAWVDRLPRRTMLIVTDLARAAALLSVPLAYAFDALTLWQLFGVGFLTGTLTVFFDVAYVAYLPSLVERRQLGEGNAKLETSRSAAYVGGPGLGGVLVQLVGAPAAVLADAVSYVVSALFLGAIRKGEERRPRVEGARLRTEVVEGIRFVLSHPYMRPSIPFVAASNFFYNVLFAVFLVYAVRSLELDPAAIGLTLMLGNVGLVLGAVTATRVGAWLGVGPTIIVCASLLGWPSLFIPLAPAEYAVPILVAVFAVLGYAGMVFNVVGISLFQATTPDRLQGRATASRRLVNFGVVPIGALTGGLLSKWVGLEETLWIGAVGATVAFVPLLFSPLRSVREVPEDGELEATPAPVA